MNSVQSETVLQVLYVSEKFYNQVFVVWTLSVYFCAPIYKMQRVCVTRVISQQSATIFRFSLQ